jgi:16S rRNA (uracil1498-N3)-methyltransferase
MRTARTIRLYSDQPLVVGGSAELDKRTSHYLVNVLRANTGDQIVLFNGDGYNYSGKICVTGKLRTINILDAEANNSESLLVSTLIQAISRGDRMDTTVQKAVELGVNEIQPVYSRHSIARLGASRSKRKLEHWTSIMLNACEQSGRSQLATVHSPQTLANYLQQLPVTHAAELRCILAPNADRPLFDNLTGNAPGKPVGYMHGSTQAVTHVMLLVGPESGFDEDEVVAALQAGFKAVRLGPRILRTETAGPAALAIMQSRYGDLCGTNSLRTEH